MTEYKANIVFKFHAPDIYFAEKRINAIKSAFLALMKVHAAFEWDEYSLVEKESLNSNEDRK